MIKALLITLFTLAFGISNAQSCIPEVKINDSIILNTLTKFILERTDKFEDFKSKGYVTIHVNYYNDKAINSDLKIILTIRDQYYEPALSNNKMFPSSYSFINEKMILFYETNFSENYINDKCKKKFLKKMQPYLEKKTHLKIKDENGRIIIDDKNFRDNTYNLHTGIILKINADKTYLLERENL